MTPQEITNQVIRWAYLSQRENPEDREAAREIYEALAKEWARLELAARDAEDEISQPRTMANGEVAGAPEFESRQVEAPVAQWSEPREKLSSPRAAANSLISLITPIFQEQARVRHWENMRPGKEPRLI
jgi:hypothetical protein